MISVENLNVAYDGRYAVLDASLSVRPGEIVGLAGPNGAGKSSLIQALMGLIEPQNGQVQINGVAMSQRTAFRRAAARIAYVPQKQNVAVGFPITVRDVVGMGQYGQLGLLGRRSAKQVNAIDDALERLSLTALQHRQFAALSGGQQQKALVARALSQGAQMLVLDEPFRGVDIQSQQSIIEALKAHRANGGSALLVHHGAEVLEDLCDTLVLLNRRVLAQGMPSALLAQPDLVPLLQGDAGDYSSSRPLEVPTDQTSSLPTMPLAS